MTKQHCIMVKFLHTGKNLTKIKQKILQRS